MSDSHPRTVPTAVVALVLFFGSFVTQTIAGTATDDPCVMVGDLDFGTLWPGKSSARTLRISNDGGGVVSFNNPSGGAVVEWASSRFTVSAADLARLGSALLRQGEFVDITVTFTATEAGAVLDTARIWASVRECRNVSYWRALVIQPGPQITGYDWEEQWITRGECAPAESPRGTKNPTDEYLAEIYAFNNGDAPFDVDRVELQGPDAAYFELDMSDPLRSIRQHDRVRPYDTVNGEPRHYQRVLFRPGPEERVYTCDVVLVTTDGQQARNTLRGLGIESRITVPEETDFGREIFGTGAPPVTRTVTIATSSARGGWRPVTITGLSLVPSTAQSVGVFTIENAGEIIGKTFPARSTIDIRVAYAPTAAGAHAAELVLSGDFSPCDDSTATLFGKVYTLNARPEGIAYGTLLTCFEDTRDIVVENNGSDAIVVYGINELGDAAGVFAFSPPALPYTLGPGERLSIPVTFAPNANGTFTAVFEFDVRDINGVSPVLSNGQPVTANVSGSGTTVQAAAHIARDYHGRPGDHIVVDVVLDRQIETARIDEVDVALRFAHGVVQQAIDANNMAALVDGTLLDGWTVSFSPVPPVIDPADSRTTVVFLKLTAPAGRFLSGAGTLLEIPFALVDGDTTSTELDFSLAPVGRLACAAFVTSSGFVQLDSLPGSALGDGLVEASVSQDPVTREVIVAFRNAAEGLIAIDLYNSVGHLVRSVAAGFLQAGRHSVRADTDGLAVGQYFVQIVTPTGERAIKVMLVP